MSLSKNLFFVCAFFLFSLNTSAQTVTLNAVGFLNDALSEPSGIEVIYNTNNGHFEYWAHNDFEYPDSIFSFRLDDLSTFTRVLDVGENYIDWEDMSTDDAGNIYIGDFGNWVGADELQVVKIPSPNTYAGAPPSVEVIKFTFPTGISDVEAMIHLNGHLYMFTKAVNPNNNPTLDDNFTYCFRIPDAPAAMGSHEAELVGSFQVIGANDDPTRSRITGADISPDKKTLALLCYARVWVFSCFEDDAFFEGTVDSFNTIYRQYEGITFINNHEVVITKEGNVDDPNFNPRVFSKVIHPYIDGNCLDCEKTINGDFSTPNLGWTKFQFGNAAATLDMNNGEAVLDIQTLGENLWHINLRHKSLILEKDKTYQISYRAHADDDRPISVIANKADGSSGYAYFAQDITTTPSYYSHTFTMNEETDFNSYLSFNVGREIAHRVFFDDISLMEIACADQVISAIEQLTASDISVYPNPFDHVINVEVPDGENYGYQIFDGKGLLVQSGKLDGEIRTSSMEAGIYFLVLENENGDRLVERVVRF